MLQLIPLRKRAQLLVQKQNRNETDLLESLSLYTESLSVFYNDPIAGVERAMVFACLGFPELAYSDAFQAHGLFKSVKLSDSINLAHTIDSSMTNDEIITPAKEKAEEYSDNTYLNICNILASSLAKLNLHTDSLHWYNECARLATGNEKHRFENIIKQVALLKVDTTVGYIPHSTSRYPWDTHDLRTKNPTAILVDIQRRIEQSSGSFLTAREQRGYGSSQLQLGIFTTKFIKHPQTLLTEPFANMLCTNSNIDSKMVCDNCNTDIRLIKYHCRLCQTVFCNENCFMMAQSKHHRQLCGKNIDAILNNIKTSSTTRSLIPLLILRAFAISITTNTHPLDLTSVRYLSNIQFEAKLHRQFDTKLFDDFKAVTDILGLQPFNQDFDFSVFLTLNDIFASNVFAIKNAEEVPWKGYILPNIDMFNHSCEPNAVLSMEEGGSRFTVKTLGDLQKDTEVCISYIASDMMKDDRQKNLLNGWGFVCKCRKCL